MDKNIAALLDTNAVTIQVTYQFSQSGDYTYICNIPGVQVGDYVVVPTTQKAEYNQVPTARKPNYRGTKAPTVDSFMETINDPEDAMLTMTDRLSIAVVSSVDKSVEIEPDDSIAYKWVIAKLDLQGYADTLARNKKILTACASAYKKNIRKSFAERILGEMEGEEKDSLLKLLGK